MKEAAEQRKSSKTMNFHDFSDFRDLGSAGNGASHRARMLDSVSADAFTNIFFIQTIFCITMHRYHNLYLINNDYESVIS